MKPSVHLYAICWNDARQLEFFFRHYDPIVDRYVIFDDGSTDGSLDLLASHPRVDVRPFPRSHAESFVLCELELFNNCWKESRGEKGTAPADWVIVCSLDEHLVHPDLIGYLAECTTAGVTAIPALGFQMFTETFPKSGERLCERYHWGVPDEFDCKLALFSPDAVAEINYEPGGHVAAPTGRILAPARDAVALRHYQHLGIEYTAARYAELAARLGRVDRGNRWGHHYNQSLRDLNCAWSDFRARRVDTSLVSLKSYEPPGWWSRLPR